MQTIKARMCTLAAVGVSLLFAAQLGAQGEHKSLAGTWVRSVTFDEGIPFDAVVTFNADGNLTETDQPDAISHASPGHGVWQRAVDGIYKFKLVKFVFGPTGVPIGTSVGRGTLRLDSERDSYESAGTNQILDLNGNVLDTQNFKTSGKRLQLEE